MVITALASVWATAASVSPTGSSSATPNPTRDRTKEQVAGIAVGTSAGVLLLCGIIVILVVTRRRVDGQYEMIPNPAAPG
jgi:hypothetical protein